MKSAVAAFSFLLSLGGFACGDVVRFNRDVRPILSTACNKCHGPDDQQRAAELRLDTEAGIRRAFEGGLQNSEAWARLSSDDPDVMMPPPDAHVEVTERQRAILRAWIEAGAKWEGHWSFIAPVRPKPPVLSDQKLKTWARSPIDAFVAARLAEQKLRPNPDADRALLLRRVTLDLTGLPPTIEQQDRFLNDSSADAYERAVDRLLSSPHFGERMAVLWMDAARYGDTSVFHADGHRDMWPWRDWVIKAFNRNIPFDQFTLEQLAGDLLPDATTDQMVATGFLRNNATTDEGGLIAEEYRVEYAIDRVKTTSMVWLGLSMECAQCHNHKYDPVTQEEYYRFFAYFNQAADPGRQTRKGNQAPVVDVHDPARALQADQLQQQLAEVQQQQADRAAAATGDFQKWLAQATRKSAETRAAPTDAVLQAEFDESTDKTAKNLADGKPDGTFRGPVQRTAGRSGQAFEGSGKNYVDFGATADFDGSHGFSYGAWIKPSGAGKGAPLARMNNANSFRGYDLHLSNGVVEPHIISRWPDNAIKVRTEQKLKPDTWQHVFVTYDGSKKAAGVRVYVDGQPWKWTIEQDNLRDSIRSRGPFYVGRRNGGTGYVGAVDDVQVYARELSPAEVAAIAGQDPIRSLLIKPAAQRSAEERAELKQYFLTHVDERAGRLQQTETKLTKQIADLKQPVTNVMVMNDVAKMRPTYVLERGSYDAPLKDQPVQPNVPAALPPLPANAPPNRLGLAQWITAPNHPLTARVTVNHLWSMLFGAGLVRSQEDFGAQGEWPSHPDLLDWLAVDFVESGWDVKRMLRQMVLSSTYRQSAVTTERKRQLDPENRLLSRAPRFRLQAEFVRDNALAAAGLLVPDIGGPGVKPYQPAGLWNEVSLNGNLRFEQDHGDKLYRRSMYIYWKRSAPAPAMTLFDAPTREKCTVRRSRTNTPLQALVTLNDVQFVEAARVMAESVLQSGGRVEQQIEQAYRRAAGVQPAAGIRQVLVEAFHEERQRFARQPDEALKLLNAGESKRDPSLDPATHAAMTVVTSMILNLDATLTRG